MATLLLSLLVSNLGLAQPGEKKPKGAQAYQLVTPDYLSVYTSREAFRYEQEALVTTLGWGPSGTQYDSILLSLSFVLETYDTSGRKISRLPNALDGLQLQILTSKEDAITKGRLESLFELWLFFAPSPNLKAKSDGSDPYADLNGLKRMAYQSFIAYQPFVREKLEPQLLELAKKNGQDAELHWQIQKSWRDELVRLSEQFRRP